ncbi:MAG: class II D-tagatose-bisphosphate aldolase, non-catalytic subunit [Alphaproteobacteria bacterium]|nr:class II D-tagatose-bisphosphate aldolase, non-catalytic subunit [Alphaproteobacteria bacterium]
MNGSLLHERLKKQLGRWPCTLLGVGVVSEVCVDAAIELANEHDVDLMLVASRRQVDTDALGSGYVCGWNAERLAAHVRARDAKGRVLLCRDHGGPWQNTEEIKRGMSVAEAMASAKSSYEEDIAAGFAVIHLDPSVAPGAAPDLETVLDRLFSLYDFCWDTAQRHSREIVFEVGAEEQDSVSHSLNDLTELLDRLNRFCGDQGLPSPTFIVVQTGTKVMETRNIGSLDSPYRIDDQFPTEIYIPRVIQSLSRFGILLKQHNTDYLSDEVLRWHPWLGIHSANVAPEFGVAESRALVHILEANRLPQLRDTFLEMAYGCHKWEKWMLPGSRASDRERAVIAGHYVFSTPGFHELKADARRALAGAGVDLDAYLKSRVKQAIMRYMTCFRLVMEP